MRRHNDRVSKAKKVLKSTSLLRGIETLEGRLLLAAHIVGSTAVYSTIQAAVDAASPGATINVDAGTYPELVTVYKNLTIQGAEAGIDARSNTRLAGTSESIVTGAGTGSNETSAFYITANDVTIDGFTVQGNTSDGMYGAGIVMAPNIAGTHILNNIVQNNVSGLFLSNDSTTDAAVIQHNVFRNNNNAGDNGGRGIYTDETIFGNILTNVTIDSNAFWGNRGSSGTTGLEAAIAIESGVPGLQSNIRVTNNAMDYNGKGVLFFYTDDILISGNVITNSQDKYSGTLRFEGGDTNVTIANNTIYDNPGPAVAVDNKGVPGDNSGFVVNNNNFYNNNIGWSSGANTSVVVNDSAYDGAFDARNNWWGDASGPSGDGAGSGDAIYGNGHVVSGSQWTTLPGGDALYSPWSTTPNGSEESPYWGAPSTSGAVIQAEDFDHGGNGIGYYTTAKSNAGGQYRPAEDAGIEATSDTGGGYDVGWTTAGEWLAYTFNAPATGSYRLDVRVASGQLTGGNFHFTVDGVNATGAMTAPDTGGTQAWQTLSVSGINITAGTHVVRLVMDSTGNGGYVANFNWFQLVNTSAAPVPSAPSNLIAGAASTSQINLSWQNNASNQTGYEVDRSSDGVNFTAIATLGPAAISYSDSGLTSSTTYSYRVLATNAAGASLPSNVAVATTQAGTSTSVNLSALNWASATVGWGTIQKNLSIKGNPLMLRGTTYASGIGTHAASQIVYNLNGQYSAFVSDVGVDDEVNGQGSVIFQVIGDGTVLFNSGVLTGASPVVHVNVSLAGVQQLTLVATNGIANSIDYDHADWAGAALIQSVFVAPFAPSTLTAIPVSASQINLSWLNNSAGQTSIEVDRSTDGTNFTPLTTLAGNSTSYSDSGLAASTTFYYRVIAIDGAGPSPASNIGSAMTLTPTSTTTYLSDLTWTSATVGWGTVQQDASIKGNTISLRGTTYQKGIGTHANSTITYSLGGKYTTFQSDIGIDDEVNGQGSVDFQLLGDGVVLYDSGTVTGSSPVGHVNVNVTGVQTLTLIVNTTTPGNIDFDHGDWAGAKLLS